MKKQEYSEGANYWDRKKPQVMGDVRQRPNLIKLLGNIKGKKVLDAGCGTGYFTRKLIKTGANIYGCDIEPSMLNIAKQNEKLDPSGIHYDLYDIRNTGYKTGFFDVIVTVGVLFHLDKKGWEKFLNEAYRLLNKKGELVFSIEHPFLFTKFSPTRTSNKSWAVHKAYEDKDYDTSQKFEEIYYKTNGDNFSSTLWHHPLEFIVNSLIKAGFSIKELKEVPIKKEDLLSPAWGNMYGYPAFLQIKAMKNK